MINGSRRQPNTEQNKKEHRFRLFLQRGINTLHKFSCMYNSVCVHITYTVVTVHAICEGLTLGHTGIYFFWREETILKPFL